MSAAGPSAVFGVVVGASRQNGPCGGIRIDGVGLAGLAPRGTIWLVDLDDVDALPL